MKEIFNQRLSKLKNKLKEINKDGIIINKQSDIFYLTGFNAESDVATLVITPENNLFFTDGRFLNQFKQQVNDFEVRLTSNNKDLYDITIEFLKDKKLTNCLISFKCLNYYNYLKFEKNKEIKLTDTKNLIDEFRIIKDNIEINNIKKACSISENSFLNLLNYIKEGISEIDIKLLLETELYKNGASGLAFDTIVASGSINSSLPHAIPSDRKIQKGDLITIDFGARYNNYCSDITRTIALGSVNDNQINIYNTVLNAKKESEKILNNNISASLLHKTADKIIKDSNNKFLHSLGHGIGIDIHENPNISANSDFILKPGMIHTIEPGIYINGVSGVRIEDDYLIKNDGFECLTQKISTNLIIL